MKSICVVTIGLALAVAGCTTAQSQSQTHTETPKSASASGSSLEVLYGMTMDNHGMKISVASNGCTSAASFETVVNAEKSSISITRLKPDHCRRRRFITEVVLLGLDVLPARGFTVENRFKVHPKG